MKYYIGIDQGKTNVRVGLINEAGEELYFSKRSYDCQSYDEMFAMLISFIGEAISEKNLTVSDLAGIGIGVPSIVNRETGMVVCGLGFDAYQDRSVTDGLAAHFKCPVAADVDTVIAAYGELWQGAGKTCGDFALITWGTGMGAGRIRNNEVVLSGDTLFPEFGHMRVSDDDVKCFCGSTGCLNALISGPAIAGQGQQASESEVKTQLTDLAAANDKVVTTAMVFEAADSGDAEALRIINRMTELFGRMCVNLVYADQPEKIVVVGGLSERSKVLTDIQTILDEQCWLIKKGLASCKIEFSELQDKAGVIGAAYMVKMRENK